MLRTKLTIAIVVLLLFGALTGIFFYALLGRPPINQQTQMVTLQSGIKVLVPAGWYVLDFGNSAVIGLSRVLYGPPQWIARERQIAAIDLYCYNAPNELQKYYNKYFAIPENFERQQLSDMQKDIYVRVREYESADVSMNGQRGLSFKCVTEETHFFPGISRHQWCADYYTPAMGLELNGYMYKGQDEYWPEVEPVFKRIIESVQLPLPAQ